MDKFVETDLLVKTNRELLEELSQAGFFVDTEKADRIEAELLRRLEPPAMITTRETAYTRRDSYELGI